MVIFIVGPTSSGKSAVSVCLAGKINGEIISCDSMQVYKDMDILSQSPSDECRARVPHHLIKIISPEEEFSAAKFIYDAQNLISSTISRGKVPVITGGTGLYFKSLLDGLFSSPPKDEAFRGELRDMVLDKGKEYIYQKLKEADPKTARKLHSNDTRRVIRALEVYHLTGRTIHEKKSESDGIFHKYNCVIFGLKLPRAKLYERINDAVERRFSAGIVEEVKRLKERRLSLTAAKALGIKEIGAFLDGEISLDKAREELKKNTRKYAKRQLTWFNADKRVVWVDADRPVGEIAEEIKWRLN
ncbi:MAG: tRNA (adenosine(37)-N6)-dimethylallyltransferase MiaA [Candidatus Omnitrophota bacterium]